MKSSFIVSACRTPIGKFMGALEAFTAVQLGTAVVREAVKRAGCAKEQVEEVIMGNVLGAGLGQNPARQAALGAGLSSQTAALTVNKVCGSGLKSVSLADQAIRLEEADVVVAGGMESMSNAPYLLLQARKGLRLGHGSVVDSMVHDGLWDVYNDYHMGCTGETVAEQYGVSREDQDRYAERSHQRALHAIRSGFFTREILPISIPQKRGDAVVFEKDEGPREDTTLESLARLKPVFKKEGTVTAGNASQISDGAAALVLMSEKAVSECGCTPKARVVASATSGVDPSLVMMAPVEAVEKVRKRAGWTDAEVDLYEVNEAFSVQSVALCRTIPLDPERLNIWGGGVALGHPIGASGARILTTLLHGLEHTGGKRGVASLCLGGGNAVAMAVERI